MLGYERVYAKINLDNVLENIANISKNVRPGAGILAVLKADAYGHGSAMIAKELELVDAVSGYAVATIEEAIEIRNTGAKKPILILSYCFPSAFDRVLKDDIRVTIFDYESALALNEVAHEANLKATIHLAVDTGMTRIGMKPDESGIQLIDKISKLSNIEIEGIYTHFARADEIDKTNVNEQIKRFEDFVALVKKMGYQIPICHCCNSASIIELPHVNMDLVRAGIILYGLWPSDEVDKNVIPLKPVMELKSSICFIKDVEAGVPISYGGTFVTDRKYKVATITVGYADGYPRCLSNKGYVLIRGKKAKILGRVCMDQMMVDVTDIEDACRGDEVTLIGKDGDEMISMEYFSELSNRINYESVCDIGKRVPRIYEKDGKIITN